ncbi:unnamed protein product [Protopolystoma xenopodis]|uniref:Uncharacterized protein n=1 Tax=Protopolystoma xenopodis TaxID=117903 RepID=A0A3S5CMF8_9PLAT|nr:unnamed protein product [Protopolystoma xenopodis]
MAPTIYLYIHLQDEPFTLCDFLLPSLPPIPTPLTASSACVILSEHVYWALGQFRFPPLCLVSLGRRHGASSQRVAQEDMMVQGRLGSMSSPLRFGLLQLWHCLRGRTNAARPSEWDRNGF